MLYKHRINVHGQSYECSICNKLFSNVQNLKKLENNHEKNKKSCELCNKNISKTFDKHAYFCKGRPTKEHFTFSYFFSEQF